MAKYQFVEFVPTPNEKHLGILSVRIHGDPISLVKYKISPRKDGKGVYPNIASYKMPDRAPGEEYDECWMPEMRSDNDSLIKFIIHSYNEWLATQQPSVFNTNQHGQVVNPPQYSASVAPYPMQQNPNYAPAAQQKTQEYQPSFLDNMPDIPNTDYSDIPF